MAKREKVITVVIAGGPLRGVCAPPVSGVLPRRAASDVAEQAAVEEGRDRVHGPCVVLVFPPLDEGNESGRVQVRRLMVRRCARVLRPSESRGDRAPGLEPRLLQARQRSGPSLRLALEQQADEILGARAHALEVVLREAEVQAADVQTGLLQALIQERRSATEDDVCHHSCKPAKRVCVSGDYTLLTRSGGARHT